MQGRAMVTVRPGAPMEMREYPVRPPRADEILVKIRIAGLCGSDLHMWRGEVPWFQPHPGIQGHEMAGEVVAFGARATTDTLGQPLQPGDRVTYSYSIPCGSCPACLHGVTGCPNRYTYRNTLTADEDPHFLGAFADYIYLQPGQWVFKVPDDLSDALVAPVNCALAQVVYGLHQIRVWLGDTVVIQGAGGLGLYAVALARDMGAGTIVAIDRVPERLALARAFGADVTINLDDYPTKEQRVEIVRDLTRGGGADVCVEVAGVAGVVQEGLEMLRVGGRYLWMGNIVQGATATIIPHDATRRPKLIQGVLTYERWAIPRALAWLSKAQHRIPLDQMVSRTYPLDQLNDAFAQAEWLAGHGQVGRIAIVP
ncbi:MAG: zinc-binding dehydrogenase [Chloroflexi bacterium]|nr:zinc-binding dehydrogenase [Chloroflexota bacterium]